jgi:prolyl oligopeptidase
MRAFSMMVLVLAASCCPPPTDETSPAVVVPDGPPIARTVDVVDKQFGLEVADPYRWMEGQRNAEHDTWLRAQGDYSAKQFAAIPGRDNLYARIRELGLGVSAVFGVKLGGRRTFHNVVPAGAQLRVPICSRWYISRSVR